jgi:plastocyanin
MQVRDKSTAVSMEDRMKSAGYLLSTLLAISMFCSVVLAQQGATTSSPTAPRLINLSGKTADGDEHSPSLAQVVALDECDPTTFNAALGPDFCKNVALAALGYATTLSDLFQKAGQGKPDAGWDFEPDTVNMKEGGILSVVDQGGEPHTFTEVAQFGGGFIDGLNNGEATVQECAGGFSKVAVARTRILQASTVNITGLQKGEHRFECCIHPWMRVTVNVKGRDEK